MSWVGQFALSNGLLLQAYRRAGQECVFSQKVRPVRVPSRQPKFICFPIPPVNSET